MSTPTSLEKLSELIWRQAADNAWEYSENHKGKAAEVLKAADPLLHEIKAIYLFDACQKEASACHIVFNRQVGLQEYTEELDKVASILPEGIALDGSRIPNSVPIYLSPISPEPAKMAATILAMSEYMKEAGLEDLAASLHKQASTLADATVQNTSTELPNLSSPTMTGLGEASGYLPGGRYSWTIPGVPRQLQGMLAGGLMGAGAGYGLGWLGSRVLPKKWDRSRLPKVMAMMGGLAGATPGLAVMGANMVGGKGVLDQTALDAYPIHSASERVRKTSSSSPYCLVNASLGERQLSKIIEESIKQAIYEDGGSGWDTDLSPTFIPIDSLNHSLFNDPRVSSTLSMPMRAATSGLVETAWRQGGSGPRFVTPADMAMVAAGMGSGYLSGAIVGKALGALLGTSEETQDKLKNIGLWSGVVRNVVPILFRQ